MAIKKSERHSKQVVSPLAIFAWSKSATAEGFELAGHLELEEQGGAGNANAILAGFTYAPAYLAMAGAYHLDPINLPLCAGTVSTQHAFISLGSIFDAAPDAWGRRVIHASEPAMSVDGATYTQAFLRGADGIGALLLKPSDGVDSSDGLDALVEWSRTERPTLAQLDEAAHASRRLENSESISDEHRRLLAGSWTIGGARPKAIIRNQGDFEMSEPLLGMSLIAKFPSINEPLDRAGIEWACLRMARDMGFEVPGHALASVATGRTLVLERFDRYPVASGVNPLMEGRKHYVSANSLVSSLVESKRMDTARDRLTFSFGKLMAMAALVANKPSKARVDMYARLVLNTALHNTDDHLKNFGFIQDDDNQSLRLAPVFDLSPQGLTEHFVHLTNLGRKYTVRDVREQAKFLGIAAGAALEVEEKILSVLEHRARYYDMAGLPLEQREKIDKLIERGTGGLLKSTAAPTRSPVVIQSASSSLIR